MIRYWKCFSSGIYRQTLLRYSFKQNYGFVVLYRGSPALSESTTIGGYRGALIAYALPFDHKRNKFICFSRCLPIMHLSFTMKSIENYVITMDAGWFLFSPFYPPLQCHTIVWFLLFYLTSRILQNDASMTDKGGTSRKVYSKSFKHLDLSSATVSTLTGYLSHIQHIWEVEQKAAYPVINNFSYLCCILRYKLNFLSLYNCSGFEMVSHTRSNGWY